MVQTFLGAGCMAGREMLYLALTRPALTWGVPFEALALNVMVTFAAGLELSAPTIWRSPVLFWAAAIPIHIGLRRLRPGITTGFGRCGYGR